MIRHNAWNTAPRGTSERTIPLFVRFSAFCALAVVLVMVGSMALASDELADVIGTRTPSEAVYPPHGLNVRFNHVSHAGLMPCRGCHRVQAGVPEAEQELIKGMDFCTRCHEAYTQNTEDPEACSFCHVGYRPLWPQGDGVMGEVRDPRFPLVGPTAATPLNANLIFSHELHTSFPCESCHPEAVNGGATLPREETCLACHETVQAPTQCVACHPSGADGRLTLRLPGSDQRSAQVLRPRDHDGGFLSAHGVAVAADPASCFVCHGESDCLACHDSSLGVRNIHEPGYMLTHGPDARRGASRCESCHNVATYCVDCHVEAGYGDDRINGPPAGYTYHGAGWYELEAGGQHSRSAQYNIMECVGCHQERECVRCHIVFDPHGPDFVGRCSRLLETVEDVCWRCHDESERELLTEQCGVDPAPR